MKKVILYNPSISTINVGDEIIFQGVYKVLKPILDESYVVNISTHLPVSYLFSKIFANADSKFVCGTNLLRNSLGGRFRQWDINFINAKALGPSTLVGVGWHNDGKKLTKYTKGLYKKILSHESIHSVRDEYTKERLKKIGFENVVNTGCATMWDLTPEFCETIPNKKAKKVVFTLTDYNKNPHQDKKIIEILNKEYEEVYLWLQGWGDYDYAKSIDILDKVKVIAPNLQSYYNFLSDYYVDYIGTRLHGGIRALQYGKRTMIFAVDNRAMEKKKDFNLPVESRKDITQEQLLKIIHCERKTEIVIPQKNILLWKKAHGII